MVAGLFVDEEITVWYVSSSFTEKDENCWTVRINDELPPPPPHEAINNEINKNFSGLFFVSYLLMYYSADGKRR